jgi:hypothetical protein
MQPQRTILQSKGRPQGGAPLVVYGIRPSRRRAVAQALELAPAAIWLLGLAGFLGPMLIARHSPHADLLKAGALAWFLVFGLINSLFAFRVLPRRRFHRNRDLGR